MLREGGDTPPNSLQTLQGSLSSVCPPPQTWLTGWWWWAGGRGRAQDVISSLTSRCSDKVKITAHGHRQDPQLPRFVQVWLHRAENLGSLKWDRILKTFVKNQKSSRVTGFISIMFVGWGERWRSSFWFREHKTHKHLFHLIIERRCYHHGNKWSRQTTNQNCRLVWEVMFLKIWQQFREDSHKTLLFKWSFQGQYQMDRPGWWQEIQLARLPRKTRCVFLGIFCLSPSWGRFFRWALLCKTASLCVWLQGRENIFTSALHF